MAGRGAIRRTISATGILAVAKVAGGIREIVIIRRLGAGLETDVYVVSVVLVTAVGSTLAGSLTTAVAAHESDYRLFSGGVARWIIGTSSAGFVAAALSLFLIPHSLAFIPTSLALLVPLFGLTGVPNARLLKEGRTTASTFYVSFHPIVSCTALLLAPVRYTVQAACVGQVVGSSIMLLFFLVAKPRESSIDSVTARPATKYSLVPFVLVGYLAYASPVTDRLVAGIFPAGAVTILGAADSLQGAVVSTLGVAVSTIAYSVFLEVSSSIADLRRLRRGALAIAVPPSLILVLKARNIVTLFYPKLSPMQAHELVSLLRILAIGIAPAVVIQVDLKWLYAQHRVKFISWVVTGLVISNFALDLALGQLVGLNGVAIGTLVILAAEVITFVLASSRGLGQGRLPPPLVDVAAP